MKERFNNWLKKKLTRWVIANYPFQATTETKIINYRLVYVKKGKLREWRMYDENNNRCYSEKPDSPLNKEKQVIY